MRESKIEKYLVKKVKKLGGEVRKIRFLDRRGAPDRMVWIPGWPMPRLVELKAPRKDLQQHQKRERTRLRKMGFRIFKVDTIIGVDSFFDIL